MSLDVETDADVTACPQCQSPVFDDELFCEACGRRVGQEPESPAASAGSRRRRTGTSTTSGRSRPSPTGARRRQRNEDALAIAAGGGRSRCGGVRRGGVDRQSRPGGEGGG